MWELEREGMDGDGGYVSKDEFLDLCEILLHERREEEEETVVWKTIR